MKRLVKVLKLLPELRTGKKSGHRSQSRSQSLTDDWDWKTEKIPVIYLFQSQSSVEDWDRDWDRWPDFFPVRNSVVMLQKTDYIALKAEFNNWSMVLPLLLLPLMTVLIYVHVELKISEFFDCQIDWKRTFFHVFIKSVKLIFLVI